MKHQPITLSARMEQIKGMDSPEAKSELKQYVNVDIRSFSLGELKWQLIKLHQYVLQQSAQKLGLYIPCNEKGEPLEEPPYYENFIDHTYLDNGSVPLIDNKPCKEYQEAFKRVIFKGAFTDASNTMRTQIWIGHTLVAEESSGGNVWKWYFTTIEQLVHELSK